MASTRNVTLEILRHGPPHNQLLSPLTEYLALCGNNPSVTVTVPWEHYQFLARHKVLLYEGELGAIGTPAHQVAREQRELQIQITGREMAAILAKIPGLIKELSDPSDKDQFTHFQLVLSSSELALLPFEMSTAPNGFPGAGQPLALQSDSPLCITRRVRRVDLEQVDWTCQPRILFAYASPPGYGLVPYRAHLLALRKIVAPWVVKHPSSPGGQAEARLEPHLKVLRHASARSIMHEIRKGHFTHVHILAHGSGYSEGVDQHFGLALHHHTNKEKLDVVGASRLASMMRPIPDDGGGRPSLPTVVTIASCHGANQGSVVGAGSSVAHALHEAGIPLVVSSQFPLSFGASVLMVQVLYNGLLWGHDPRVLLNDLRRQLKADFPLTHDWASLVAYSAFPENFEDQLRVVMLRQAKRAIESVFVESDHAFEQFHVQFREARRYRCKESSSEQTPEETGTETSCNQQQAEDFRSRVRLGKKRLESLMQEDNVHLREVARLHGLMASVEKREGDMEFNLYVQQRKFQITSEDYETPGSWRENLLRSRDHYRRVFELDRAHSWALVQDVALTLVLHYIQHSGEAAPEASLNTELNNKLTVAKMLCEAEMFSDNRIERASAISNLIELEIVSLAIWPNDVEPTRTAMKDRYEVVRDVVFRLADDLPKAVREGEWEIVSRRRQSKRYVSWFFAQFPGYHDFDIYENYPHDVPCLIKGLNQLLLERLPER